MIENPSIVRVEILSDWYQYLQTESQDYAHIWISVIYKCHLYDQQECTSSKLTRQLLHVIDSLWKYISKTLTEVPCSTEFICRQYFSI